MSCQQVVASPSSPYSLQLIPTQQGALCPAADKTARSLSLSCLALHVRLLGNSCQVISADNRLFGQNRGAIRLYVCMYLYGQAVGDRKIQTKMEWCITYQTLPLSIPSPKAIVAQTTCTPLSLHPSCIWCL